MTAVDQLNHRHASASDDWGTPAEIVEAARALMGGIDLDPASSERHNLRVGATEIFGDPDEGYVNGFTAPWHGRVFLNPPGGHCDAEGHRVPSGGRSAAKAWWFKLAAEYQAGRVSQAVFVGFSIEILQTTQVPAPPGAWCATERGLAVPLDFPLCVPSRRIAFVGPDERPVRGMTHASVIVWLPERPKRGPPRPLLRDFFSGIGRCR